jgi:hypothetical protein
MVSPSPSPEAASILQLLTDYSFDTENCWPEAVVAGWLQQFNAAWVSQAITEALYQGRYKLVSVDHILQLWQRRGHPLCHFNREFESIILGQTLLCLPPGVGAPRSINSTTSATEAISTETTEATAVSSPDSSTVEDHSLTQESALEPLPPEKAPEVAAVATSPMAEPVPSDDIPRFRPITEDLSSELSSIWAPVEAIQPFVPQLETSEFHQRLKAVVKGSLAEN